MRPLLFIVAGFVALTSYADNPSALIDSLISRGNRAYELSQPSKIKLYADSAGDILDSRALEGDALKDYSVSVLKLMGNYHYEKANLDSAERYYNHARIIMDRNPNTDFRVNRLLLPREFAQLYYRKGDYRSALDEMQRVDSIPEFNQTYEPGGKEWLISKMTYAMCLARMNRADEAIAIAASEIENANEKEGLDYAKALRMYAKIRLLADVDRQGALRAYKDYFVTQKRFAQANFANMDADEREEYWHTLRPFITDCYLLEEEDPGFLYDVTLFSKGLLLQLMRISGDGNASSEALKTLDWRWTDIQKKLKPGEAAIEFMQYEKNGEAAMAALIVKSAGKPQFIRMTPPDEILAIAGDALSSTGRNGKDEVYGDGTLQSLVWTEPLLAAISRERKVYFAPDGYLHRVAMEYMPQVSDKDLYRLTSTRRLMEPGRAYSSADPVLAFGVINFNLDKSPGMSDGNDENAYSNYVGMRFPQLSALTDEAIAIIAYRNNPADSLQCWSMASEGRFRNLSPDYSAILLSTHGDFRVESPISTDIKPVMADEVMSRSILAFAGVNSYLMDREFDASANYDGILSAKELSQIDLSNCRLFVASACQTALGEITADGVFGLQRGLKNAGVDTMLLSLWNVNSEATFELMRLFYRNLDKGMTLHDAFKHSREELLSREPEESLAYVFDPAIMADKAIVTKGEAFNSPQFTDAFILIDAIE